MKLIHTGIILSRLLNIRPYRSLTGFVQGFGSLPDSGGDCDPRPHPDLDPDLGVTTTDDELGKGAHRKIPVILGAF